MPYTTKILVSEKNTDEAINSRTHDLNVPIILGEVVAVHVFYAVRYSKPASQV